MDKVLLLGDSIRMGYDEFVRDDLKGRCEVLYDEEDNGRFSSYTLWQANQMFKKYGKVDVVHWNNGYWDMNVESPMTEAMHPVDEYVHFLKRIISLIRANGADIIFATTTPILEREKIEKSEMKDIIGYDNEWVRKYNSAATDLMKSENIRIDDLYTLCLEDKNYYKCPDMLHLTEQGYRKCAEKASKMILEVLDERHRA
jgi:lysophospholipase L1-like esterase